MTSSAKTLRALSEKATQGEWHHHAPGCCRFITYRDGVICEVMNNEVDMQDATGHAPTPEQAQVNMQFITALVNWFRKSQVPMRLGRKRLRKAACARHAAALKRKRTGRR